MCYHVVFFVCFVFVFELANSICDSTLCRVLEWYESLSKRDSCLFNIIITKFLLRLKNLNDCVKLDMLHFNIKNEWHYSGDKVVEKGICKEGSRMFVKERLPNGGKTLWNALENREASQGLSDVMG